MIVTTEHGQYRIDEEGRGQFRVTVLSCDMPGVNRPCVSGRYRAHIVPVDIVGRTGVFDRLAIGLGKHLTFSDVAQDVDPCCGFSNRIVAIEA